MTQCERILELLESKEIVDNYELNKIAFRYSARIGDLRKDGYDIKAKHDTGSRWLFKLVKDPIQQEMFQ